MVSYGREHDLTFCYINFTSLGNWVTLYLIKNNVETGRVDPRATASMSMSLSGHYAASCETMEHDAQPPDDYRALLGVWPIV